MLHATEQKQQKQPTSPVFPSEKFCVNTEYSESIQHMHAHPMYVSIRIQFVVTANEKVKPNESKIQIGLIRL